MIINLSEQSISHPGILEVPDDKKVYELPISHFKNLANKKGYSSIIKALVNLVRWNKNDNPKLSKKVDNIVKELHNWHYKNESTKEDNKMIKKVNESIGDSYKDYKVASVSFDIIYSDKYDYDDIIYAIDHALKEVEGYYLEPLEIIDQDATDSAYSDTIDNAIIK